MAEIPLVFLSATRVDLKEHRLAAARAIHEAGFHAVTMEFFAAEDAAPLDVCLREVEKCDALVVLVAHRYGWVPPAQAAPGGKSITWLECLHAQKLGKPIFPFLLDEKHPRLLEFKEIQRVIDAHMKGGDAGKASQEASEAESRLKEFKAWLDKERGRAGGTLPRAIWQSKFAEASRVEEGAGSVIINLKEVAWSSIGPS